MKGIIKSEVEKKFLGLWHDIDNAATAVRELCSGNLKIKVTKKSNKWELEEECKKLDALIIACDAARFDRDYNGADLGLYDDDVSEAHALNTVYLVLNVVYETIISDIDFTLRNTEKTSFKAVCENYDLLKYRSRIA